MTFEYKCKCGYKFEIFHIKKPKAIIHCPKCRGVAKKVYSIFNTEMSRVQK